MRIQCERSLNRSVLNNVTSVSQNGEQTMFNGVGRILTFNDVVSPKNRR